MANIITAETFPVGVCNMTEQCAAIDPNMTCSNHHCVCLSLELAAGGGLCNSTVGMLDPRSLGQECSDDANCTSTVPCIDGRCSCPLGFGPWGERNCSPIYEAAPAATWITILLGFWGIVLIVVFVLCIWVFAHRGFEPSWPQGYVGRKQSTTLIVWSQASFGDQAGSTPTVLPQRSHATETTSGQQMDSDLFSDVLRLDSLLVAGEHSTELTNQMTTMSELRGLCSVPEDSFVRPVLSGEELYRKYPHLRDMLSLFPEAPLSTSTPVRSVQRSESSLTSESTGNTERRSALSTALKSRKVSPRAEVAARNVAFPLDAATFCVPASKPESESEPLGQTLPGSQAFGTSSAPWSSFGSSMDSLLGIPVVARFYTSTSDTDTPVHPSRGKSSDGPATSLKGTKPLRRGRSCKAPDIDSARPN